MTKTRELKHQLARYRQIKLTVVGRKSGKAITNPVWFVAEGDTLFRTALIYLVVIGCVYLLREAINVVRRYFVENTCTRIDRDMTVRVVGHLLKVDMRTFTHEKVGALHGRISRSVEGPRKGITARTPLLSPESDRSAAARTRASPGSASSAPTTLRAHPWT